MIIKGDQVKPGQEVELTSDEARAFDPSDLSPSDGSHVPSGKEEYDLATGKRVNNEPEPPKLDPVAEKPLEEMNQKELQAKAKELNLSTSGSKADLMERITLHQAEHDIVVDDEQELPDNI